MKPRLSRSLRRILVVVVVCSSYAQAVDLNWNGDATDNTWSTDATNTNWLDVSTPAPFASGDNVTFEAAVAPVVNKVQVGEALQAGTVTVNGDYTFETTAESSVSADFAGSGTLTKSGEYELVLTAGEGSTAGPALAVAAGNLALEGKATYRKLADMADGTQLDVREGADISFAEGATGRDVVLQGDLALNGGDSSLNSVTGSGTLSVAENATLGLAADSMVGSLSNSGAVMAAGNLLIESRVENGGELSAARLILPDGGTFTTLRTDHLVIGRSVADGAPVTAQKLGAYSGTDMVITLSRPVSGSGDYLVVQSDDVSGTTYTLSADTVERLRSAGYNSTLAPGATGLVLTLDSFNNGYHIRHMLSSNGAAGAALLDQAFADIDPRAARTKYPDLARVMDAMERYISGGDYAAADRLAANVAGAGLANLNTAFRGQMERQMRAIRNRMTSLQGGMPCYPPDPKAPMSEPLRYTLWANAEIDYQNQRGESALPGYKLHSIGGTAGFAALCGKELTMGAAFTGMSGRLSSKGYGSDASGDLDAYYANIFMRKDFGCWQHSLIGTAGWADINFKRRVNFPGGGYNTRGTTDGLGLGVMYEIARTYRISQETMKSAWWQPVFNVSYVHSKIDSYTETGSDAALHVGKQDSSNVIFGLGARMQGVVGENAFNTPAIMEARVLGKAMVGARRGKARVDIPGVDMSSTVRGAEAGAMGVEIGLGFNIPLGRDYGAIITDVTAEFYQDQTSVNGVLGYRIDF